MRQDISPQAHPETVGRARRCHNKVQQTGIQREVEFFRLSVGLVCNQVLHVVVFRAFKQILHGRNTYGIVSHGHIGRQEVKLERLRRSHHGRRILLGGKDAHAATVRKGELLLPVKGAGQGRQRETAQNLRENAAYHPSDLFDFLDKAEGHIAGDIQCNRHIDARHA